MDSRKPSPVKKRKLWTSETEKVFIDVWKEKVKLLHLKKKKWIMYKDMAETLQDKGINVSRFEVTRKAGNCTQKYKKLKAAIGPPNGSPSGWKFYEDVHRIIVTQERCYTHRLKQRMEKKKVFCLPDQIKATENLRVPGKLTKHMRNLWTTEAEKVFIDVWKEKVKMLRIIKKKSLIYKDMAEKLQAKGIDVSWLDIRKKIDNFSQKYRKLKSKGSTKVWNFYEDMHRIIIALEKRPTRILRQRIVTKKLPDQIQAKEQVSVTEKVTEPRLPKKPMVLENNTTDPKSKEPEVPRPIVLEHSNTVPKREEPDLPKIPVILEDRTTDPKNKEPELPIVPVILEKSTTDQIRKGPVVTKTVDDIQIASKLIDKLLETKSSPLSPFLDYLQTELSTLEDNLLKETKWKILELVRNAQVQQRQTNQERLSTAVWPTNYCTVVHTNGIATQTQSESVSPLPSSELSYKIEISD